MKAKIYLRVAKTETRDGYRVAASTRPNNEPLNANKGYKNETWYPTIAFAVEVDLPDELFDQASRVIAQLNVSMQEAQVSSEIVVPEGITVKASKRS